MNNQITLVLVHGAGTGPWIWGRMQECLNMPSVTPEVNSRNAEANPDICAENIVRQIDQVGAERVTLVLHSLAGVMASALHKRLGDRVVSTVFVASVIPADGKCFADTVGFPGGFFLKVLFKFNPKGLRPSEKMLRTELCNDLSEAESAELIGRYESEWPGLYLSSVKQIKKGSQAIYVRLLNDRCILPKLQDKMIANLQNPRVEELDSGHMAMLASPDELAKIIMRAS